MKIEYAILTGVVIIIATFVLYKSAHAPNILDHQEVVVSDSDHDARMEIGGTTIDVKFADDSDEREQGLSGVTGITTDWGMLFIFDVPGNYAFWMKDMYFPIDMIWFDENQKIVYIKENALPESYPESFAPPKEKTSKYVLEVFSGFVRKHNLKIGDEFKLLSR